MDAIHIIKDIKMDAIHIIKDIFSKTNIWFWRKIYYLLNTDNFLPDRITGKSVLVEIMGGYWTIDKSLSK